MSVCLAVYLLSSYNKMIQEKNTSNLFLGNLIFIYLFSVPSRSYVISDPRVLTFICTLWLSYYGPVVCYYTPGTQLKKFYHGLKKSYSGDGGGSYLHYTSILLARMVQSKKFQTIDELLALHWIDWKARVRNTPQQSVHDVCVACKNDAKQDVPL